MALKIRPSGQLSWLLPRCNFSNIDILGCISTEERCLSAFKMIKYSFRWNSVKMVRIFDNWSPRNPIEAKARYKISKFSDDFVKIHGSQKDIADFPLFTQTYDLVSFIDDFISNSCGNVIVDISAMPKRFFFCIIKILLKSVNINNIIVTNTRPLSYANEMLAENFDSLKPLPLFAHPTINSVVDYLFVSVGHMPMGLTDQIEDLSKDSTIYLIFPFPGTPSSLKYTWKFVYEISQAAKIHDIEILRISASNASELFDCFEAITSNGLKSSLFTPYGPKPFSLAIALFASKYSSQVSYTQPRFYNPDYSIGVATHNGLPNINSYLIKHKSTILY